jgi:nucleoside-diphosphate-sugar epimerase
MSNFTNTKILVVGGAGFVGSNLSHRLLKDNPQELIIVDNLLSADASQLPVADNVRFIHSSINADEVLDSLPEDLDYVFHLATYHGNQSSMADPLADHENNTLTSLKLFNKIKDFKNLKKVVYSSAGCTVAQKTFESAEATTEDDSVSLYLDSPYQISKIIGEFYGNYFFSKYDMPFVKARFQNVYGPREVLGAGQWRGTVNTVWRNVTPTFIFKAMHQEGLPVENKGIATRDLIYVDDIVEGLVCCALNGKAGGIYNLASGVETSILELAETINRLTNNPTAIDFKPARSWDRSGKRYGATEKAKQEIGFEAKVGLEEGITKTVAWMQDNMELIQTCIGQHIDKAPDVAKYCRQTAEA